MSDIDTLYSEKQKMTMPIVYIVCILCVFLSAYEFIQQMSLENSFENISVESYVVILFSLLLNWLIFSTYLQVEISKTSIKIKYYPFFVKKIDLSLVDKLQVVDYNPIKEYGGWGIRGSKKCRVYSMSGKMALSISLFNGNKILVGTKLPDMLKQTLLTLKK